MREQSSKTFVGPCSATSFSAVRSLPRADETEVAFVTTNEATSLIHLDTGLSKLAMSNSPATVRPGTRATDSHGQTLNAATDSHGPHGKQIYNLDGEMSMRFMILIK